METLEDTFDRDRALVFGIGGGGDVVGSIPTARLLETHHVDTVLGGVAWERTTTDPRPGPRHLDEIEGIDRLNGSVALVTGETRTSDNVEFVETGVARHYGEEVVLIDIGDGVRGVVDGIEDACDRLEVDLVVGVDAGGDILAEGHESGLRSPLVDAMMLAVLTDVDVDACIGMYGYGSDGELTFEEVTDGIVRAAGRGGLLGAWGLTPRIVSELEELLEVVTTEASRLPVEVARGERSEATIREGERTVELPPASTVTFYLDPSTVAETSDLVSLVRGTTSFLEAHESLMDAGYETELALERKRMTED